MPAAIDVYFREVPPDKYYHEGFKYALNYRVKENGIWIVKNRIDNKEGKGHHVHFGNRVENYNYTSFEGAINYILTLRGRSK
jgi:hypothetical protein